MDEEGKFCTNTREIRGAPCPEIKIDIFLVNCGFFGSKAGYERSFMIAILR